MIENREVFAVPVWWAMPEDVALAQAWFKVGTYGSTPEGVLAQSLEARAQNTNKPLRQTLGIPSDYCVDADRILMIDSWHPGNYHIAIGDVILHSLTIWTGEPGADAHLGPRPYLAEQKAPLTLFNLHV